MLFNDESHRTVGERRIFANVPEQPDSMTTTATLQVVVNCGNYKTFQEVSLYSGMRVLDAVAHLALQHKMASFHVLDSSSQRQISLTHSASSYAGHTLLLCPKQGSNQQTRSHSTCEESNTTDSTSSECSYSPPSNQGLLSCHPVMLPFTDTDTSSDDFVGRKVKVQLEKEVLFIQNLEKLIHVYCPLIERHSVFADDVFQVFQSWLLNIHHFVKLLSHNLTQLLAAKQEERYAERADKLNIQLSSLNGQVKSTLSQPNERGFPRSTSMPMGGSLVFPTHEGTRISPQFNVVDQENRSREIAELGSGDGSVRCLSECLNRNLWQTLYAYTSNFATYQKGVNKALQCNSSFCKACHKARHTSVHSVVSLMFTPVQKLEEYKLWMDDICEATAVGSSEYSQLASHSVQLSQLLSLHRHKTSKSAPTSAPHTQTQQKLKLKSNLEISEDVNQNLTHAIVVREDKDPNRDSVVVVTNKQPLTRRNLKKKGVAALRNRRKSLSDLTEFSLKGRSDMSAAPQGLNDPANPDLYSGGAYVMDAPIKMVHKNTITDCFVYLYEAKMVVAKINSLDLEAEDDTATRSAPLEVVYEVPVCDLWYDVAPTPYVGSRTLVDETIQCSILIGWPIVNVKFIFKTVLCRDSFLDDLTKVMLHANYLSVHLDMIDSSALAQMPLTVHNELTSKLSAGSSSPSTPTEQGDYRGVTLGSDYIPVITECLVEPKTIVKMLVDDICKLSFPMSHCCWIRFGKKHSADKYMQLLGFERLYPIVKYCYENLSYAKRKSNAFSPCHFYITEYGKYPSEHPKNKEKQSTRKISVAAFMPGGGGNSAGVGGGSKRKSSHGLSFYQQQLSSTPSAAVQESGLFNMTSNGLRVASNGAALFHSSDSKLCSSSSCQSANDCQLVHPSSCIFGRPLTEISVGSYPPVAIRELLYAIYLKCPPVQGVFRTPCSSAKKAEFKAQLDSGNHPDDWLSGPDLTPNLLCDTLKDFLQHLPGGLFGVPTKELLKAHSKGFLELKMTLLDMPEVNYQLLVRVVFVLSECLRGQQVNLDKEKQLSVEGLAICIAPSVFSDATHEMIHPTKPNAKNSWLDAKKLLVLILENHQELFSDFWAIIQDEFERAASQMQSNKNGSPSDKDDDEFFSPTGDQKCDRFDFPAGESTGSPEVDVGSVSSSRNTGHKGDQTATTPDVVSGGGSCSTTTNTASSPSGRSFDSGLGGTTTTRMVAHHKESLVGDTPAPHKDADVRMRRKSSDAITRRYNISAGTGASLNPKPPVRNTSYLDDKKRAELEYGSRLQRGAAAPGFRPSESQNGTRKRAPTEFTFKNRPNLTSNSRFSNLSSQNKLMPTPSFNGRATAVVCQISESDDDKPNFV